MSTGEIGLPRYRTTPAAAVARAVLYLALLAGAAWTLYPYLWMVFTSYKPMAELNNADLLPHRFTLVQYRKLFEVAPMWLYFLNSIKVAAVGVTLRLLFCTMAGYAFAKHRFPGRGLLFAFVLATMMLPASLFVVPSFIICSRLGWINRVWALTVPGAADAFGIFLARQYILSAVPSELLEAAKLDGAGEWSVFTRVVLPVCRPLLAALGIITFTYLWNDFFGPLIYFNKAEVFTLPIGLQNLSLPRGQLLQGVQMAGGFLVTLPMVIVFIALQRQFIGSLTAAALKG